MNGTSRRKGARAEVALAALLREFGFDATRNARNGISAEDVTHTVPGFWVEVKCRERLNIWEALAQATAGALANPEPHSRGVHDPETGFYALADFTSRTPSVWFKRNRTDWYVALPARALLELLTRETK